MTLAIDDYTRLLVLTGAGVSAESGVPTFRDANGLWENHSIEQVATPQGFEEDPALVWRFYSERRRKAKTVSPNPGHVALAQAEERMGERFLLVTQNIDGLHQRAGSRRVVDLHGRLDFVECLGCGAVVHREDVQALLLAWNPRFAPVSDEARGAARERTGVDGEVRPDGDVAVAASPDDLQVPDCRECGGVLKPRVVFFGENVPRPRVEQALAAVDAADALLVVGSSLMVYSGYRFVRAARERGRPVALVNLGRTRADGECCLKLERDCATLLAEAVAAAS